MRLRLITLGLLLALILGAMLVVSLLRPALSDPPSTRAIASPSPALASEPPVVMASYAGQEQRGTLGSYCGWNGCPDTLFLIPAQSMTVPLAAQVQFEFSEPVPPHNLLVTIFLLDTSKRLPSPDPNLLALGARSELARAFPPPARQFQFQMPDRAGGYALSLFGEWETSPHSGPDAYYGFHIAVAE